MHIDYLKNSPHFAEELNRLCFNEWGYLFPGSTSEEWLARLKDRMNDKAIPLALVASRKDEFMGTASLFQCDMEDRQHLFPWLAAVFVKSEFRNQGVGTRLLNSIDAECLKLGYDRYYLYTGEARNFYLKRGWAVIEERRYHGEEVVVMGKTINSPPV
ncbi:MAG: GNAT family N-acetyltransferase [Desulfobacter sp.]|nr:MAG: GNAT family N-acetyltransferase [Desulfobacter sp.]